MNGYLPRVRILDTKSFAMSSNVAIAVPCQDFCHQASFSSGLKDLPLYFMATEIVSQLLRLPLTRV